MSRSRPSIRHLQRSREIADTFIRHGFGYLFDQLEPKRGWVLRLPPQRKSAIGLPLLLPLTASGSLPRWLIMLALIPVSGAGLWLGISLLSTPGK